MLIHLTLSVLGGYPQAIPNGTSQPLGVYHWGFRTKKKTNCTWPCTSITSSTENGKELFKGSKNSASLLVYTRKKFFGWGLRIFCEWRHKWSSFWAILAHVTWPRAQLLGRSILLKFLLSDSDKDQMALSRHYSENHSTIKKPPLHKAYTITFVKQPSCHSLDIFENKWYHLIDAQINIQNMDPSPCEIIITMLCAVWLNPMLSSALCTRFSLNTACLLPPQRLKWTRSRFKCIPQRLTACTWLTIFLYRC